MDLTPEEREFIKNYRKLNSHEKELIEDTIDYLSKDQKKRDFKLCEKKEAKK